MRVSVNLPHRVYSIVHRSVYLISRLIGLLSLFTSLCYTENNCQEIIFLWCNRITAMKFLKYVIAIEDADNSVATHFGNIRFTVWDM